jgi:DNA-binding XRE family transcriptional regulator
MAITGKHIAAARALLGITQQQLADAVGVAKHTVVRFETEQNEPRPLTVKALQDELERRGIEFQNSGDPGVRLFRSKAKKAGA